MSNFFKLFMIIDDSDSGRGKRLRQLRKITGLNSAILAEKLKVSRATISIWENAPTGKGITKKGAQNVIKFINSLGINCDINWLWFGSGNDPSKFNQSQSDQPSFLSDTEYSTEKIKNEIDFFYSCYRNAITYEIKNLSMYPFYNNGDIVGGLWEPASRIGDSFNDCILKIDNNFTVRRVKKINNKYTVSFYSACESETEPFLIENIDLDKVAIIKRIWKK